MKLLTDIEFVFNVRFIRDNQIEFICVSMLTNREQTTKIHRLTHGQTVESCFYNLLIFWSWIKLNQLNEDKWIVDCPNAYPMYICCRLNYSKQSKSQPNDNLRIKIKANPFWNWCCPWLFCMKMISIAVFQTENR